MNCLEILSVKVWWYICVIPALGRQKQEEQDDCEVKAIKQAKKKNKYTFYPVSLCNIQSVSILWRKKKTVSALKIHGHEQAHNPEQEDKYSKIIQNYPQVLWVLCVEKIPKQKSTY